MNKKLLVLIKILIVTLIGVTVLAIIGIGTDYTAKKMKSETANIENQSKKIADITTNMTVVPTMRDVITSNGSWCRYIQQYRIFWNR